MKKQFKKKSSGDWKKKKGGHGYDNSMHKAICGNCKKECGVPFKPNGRKPVLCSICFRQENKGGLNFDKSFKSDKPAYRSIPRENNNEVVRQLKKLNGKMDQMLEMFAGMSEEI